MESARTLPRLGMLREITDASILAEVFLHGRVTRVGLAETTGISGPTVWESVRRLTDAGLLREAGSRETHGRGRAATYYELTQSAGWVLALTVNQQGVHARAAGMAGDVFAENHQEAGAPGDADSLLKIIRLGVREAASHADGRGTLRAVAMSVANPVRPGTSEIVAMPHSPFPEGMLLPSDDIAEIAGAPLLIDNDVNLAALAERQAGPASLVSSFAYLFVGGGLGLALYTGDQLIRGAHGLAGEIGYLPALADSELITLAESLARQGFRHTDAPAINVAAVLDIIGQASAGDPAAVTAVREFGTSIGHAVAAACVVADPELVLLGGPIGSQPALLEPVRTAVAQFWPARVLTSHAGESAPLQGALHLALEHGRKLMVGRSE
jgi:predicted NBD/HSP70 family sugar kinase